jgi:hypothetical protein
MDTAIRRDADWQSAAKDYITQKLAAEEISKAVDRAKAKLADLAQHNNERGFGVAVCKFWKGNAGKQEIRITLLKSEAVPC